jgi:hypothetical protein
MNQDKKAKIVAALKPILKQYGIKATFGVRHHSTFVVNIKSGSIDFIENFIKTDENKASANKMSADQVAYIRKNQSVDVNPYWFQEHFSGKAKDFLVKLFSTIKSEGEWFDESDIMTDYFHTAFYVDVNIGSWNKHYTVA